MVPWGRIFTRAEEWQICHHIRSSVGSCLPGQLIFILCGWCSKESWIGSSKGNRLIFDPVAPSLALFFPSKVPGISASRSLVIPARTFNRCNGAFHGNRVPSCLRKIISESSWISVVEVTPIRGARKG